MNKRGAASTPLAVATAAEPPPMNEHERADAALGIASVLAAKTRPSGAAAIKTAIVAHVLRHPGATERQIAQALFGRDGVQQMVNSHCRELARTGHLERLPTSRLPTGRAAARS